MEILHPRYNFLSLNVLFYYEGHGKIIKNLVSTWCPKNHNFFGKKSSKQTQVIFQHWIQICISFGDKLQGVQNNPLYQIYPGPCINKQEFLTLNISLTQKFVETRATIVKIAEIVQKYFLTLENQQTESAVYIRCNASSLQCKQWMD